MKKVLLGLAALLAALIVAVVVAPSFIDWTSYRNGIAAEIERVLGRRVVIDGAVEASIVPSPRLSLHGVSLGNLAGASSSTMARAEALEVRVAFWPLLTGKLVVTSVVLRKPVIELERLADGRANWLFAGNGRGRTNEGLPENVQFENVVITDGTVIYRDARSGAEQKLEGVNGRFATDGIYGPLRVVGELRYGSIPLRFSLSTGRLDPRGQAATPVNFMAEIPGAAHGLTRAQAARGTASFTGNVRFADSGPQLDGQAKLHGDDLADFVASLGMGERLPGVLAQAFNLEGALELKDDVLSANGLTVQLGDTRAQGAVNGTLSGDQPQLDVALTVGRIDLDAWIAAAAKKAKSQETDAAAEEAGEFILPVGLHMTLDVSADALTYKDGAARQAKLMAELSDGVVDIHQFSVQLPGATDASFNGKLLAVEGYARLDGQVEVASDDFRSLLGWLNLDITGLPAGRLNKVSATSHLALTRDTLDVGDLDLRFDATRLTGALVVALRERPALGVNLIVDRINLDSYIPPEIAEAAETVATQAARGAMPLTILTEFDANMRLRVGRLEKGTTVVRNATLDGTLINGVLTMRKLAIADLAGGAVTLAGKLDGFRDKLGVDLEFEVDAREPTDLLRLVGLSLPLPDDALKPFAAHGKISGRDAAYKIDGTVNAAVMALSLKGGFAVPPDAPATFAFDVGVEHPNYAGFLRLFDPAFAPEREAQARAVSLTGHVASDGKAYTLSGVSGLFGPLTVNGNGSLAFDKGLPHITAQVSAGDIDTANFLSASQAQGEGEHWSTAPIDVDLARLIDGTFTITGKSLHHDRWTVAEPKIEAVIGNGGIDLKQLSGRMLGGQLALQGRLMPTGRSDAAMALDFSLSLSGAELGQGLFDSRGIDLSGGRLDLTAEGAGVGTSEGALLAGMNGKGSLALQNTTLKGFDLGRLNSRYAEAENPGELVRLIRSTMSSGSTRLASAKGDFTISNGTVAFDDLRLKTAAGDARVLLAADLPHWRLDSTAEVRLAKQPNAPSFEMQLGGPLDAPKRDFASDALQAFLEESARRTPPRAAPQNTRQPAPQNTPQPARQAPQTLPAAPPSQTPRPSTPSAQPPRSAPTSQAAPPQRRNVLPETPAATARQTPDPRNPSAPRVLSVSPNAPPGTAIPNTPTPSAPMPSGRVLSISPNAATPESSVPGARVLSVSPNAEPSGRPSPDSSGAQGAPPARQAEQDQTLGKPAQTPQPAPQPATPDRDSFARDVLRSLEP